MEAAPKRGHSPLGVLTPTYHAWAGAWGSGSQAKQGGYPLPALECVPNG
jgi:hypothetical protein